jgi:hypothetical protein
MGNGGRAGNTKLVGNGWIRAVIGKSRQITANHGNDPAMPRRGLANKCDSSIIHKLSLDKAGRMRQVRS